MTPEALPSSSPLPFQRQVLSLRYCGHSESEIANILECTQARVNTALNRAMAASTDAHRAAIVREAEILKLEQMDETFLPVAIEGSVRAASVVLKCMERRANLMGLDQQQNSLSRSGTTLIAILAGMGQSQPQLPEPKVIDG